MITIKRKVAVLQEITGYRYTDDALIALLNRCDKQTKSAIGAYVNDFAHNDFTQVGVGMVYGAVLALKWVNVAEDVIED